jgi:presenilin-like A22 family membrane protease
MKSKLLKTFSHIISGEIKLRLTNYVPLIGMALMLLLVQLIAVALSEPFEANEFKAFSNPEAASNVIIWIAIILVFTALIFLVIKMNKKWMIQAFILVTVVSTLYYVFFAIFSMFLSLEIDRKSVV